MALAKRWSKELQWRLFSCSDSALPSVAENFAVAVRDMNAVLIEKQQQLLARAEEAPLELAATTPTAQCPRLPYQPEEEDDGP